MSSSCSGEERKGRAVVHARAEGRRRGAKGNDANASQGVPPSCCRTAHGDWGTCGRSRRPWPATGLVVSGPTHSPPRVPTARSLCSRRPSPQQHRHTLARPRPPILAAQARVATASLAGASHANKQPGGAARGCGLSRSVANLSLSPGSRGQGHPPTSTNMRSGKGDAARQGSGRGAVRFSSPRWLGAGLPPPSPRNDWVRSHIRAGTGTRPDRPRAGQRKAREIFAIASHISVGIRWLHLHPIPPSGAAAHSMTLHDLDDGARLSGRDNNAPYLESFRPRVAFGVRAGETSTGIKAALPVSVTLSRTETLPYNCTRVQSCCLLTRRYQY